MVIILTACLNLKLTRGWYRRDVSVTNNSGRNVWYYLACVNDMHDLLQGGELTPAVKGKVKPTGKSKK